MSSSILLSPPGKFRDGVFERADVGEVVLPLPHLAFSVETRAAFYAHNQDNLTMDGSGVAAISDVSGNGYDLTVTGDSSTAVIHAAMGDAFGLKAEYTPGYFLRDGSIGILGSDSFSMFIVFRPQVQTQRRNPIEVRHADNSYTNFNMTNTSLNTDYKSTQGGAYGVSSSANYAGVSIFGATTSNEKYYINGAIQFDSNVAALQSDLNRITLLSGLADGQWFGHLGCAIICKGVATQQDVDDFNVWATSVFGTLGV